MAFSNPILTLAAKGELHLPDLSYSHLSRRLTVNNLLILRSRDHITKGREGCEKQMHEVGRFLTETAQAISCLSKKN